MNNTKIAHGLWIGGKLSLLEKLTIKSLQAKGYEFWLWSYVSLDDVPEGVVVKDANQILSSDKIFVYQGVPLNGIPGGGMGSYSHYSDMFALHLLDIYGGLWTQMDVTYIKEPSNADYIFVRHAETNIGPYILKCPAGCDFTRNGKTYLADNIDQQKVRHMMWDWSMSTLGELAFRYVPNVNQYFLSGVLDLGCATTGPFFENVVIDENVLAIHWSNATLRDKKNNPISGSTYEQLLKQYNLWT